MNQRNDPQYREYSKVRLSKITKTKITTAFIGAIDSFEEAFGYLWGHYSKNPTAEQKRMRQKWEAVRRNILDKGNNQIRAISQELEYYDIIWNRYNIEFRQPHTGDRNET